MTPKDHKPSSPDWFARALAVLGFLLAVLSLGWQIYTYRESHEESVAERVQADLSAFRTFDKKEGWAPKGKIVVEVVNVGFRPLYVNTVALQFESPPGSDTVGTIVVLYGAGAITGKQLTQLLQPSESAMFSQEWNFSEHPLTEWPPAEMRKMKGLSDPTIVAGRKEDITVQVSTTKKSFLFPHSTVITQIR